MTITPYVKRPLADMMDLANNLHRLTAILHRIAENDFIGGGEHKGHYTLLHRKGVIYTSDEWMIDSDETKGLIQAIRIEEGKGVSSIEFSLGLWQMAISDLDYVDPEIALRADIERLQARVAELEADRDAVVNVWRSIRAPEQTSNSYGRLHKAVEVYLVKKEE